MFYNNYISIRIILFQFLIGTLETLETTKARKEDSEFQFLIGTLETKHARLPSFYEPKFQFLIGTLET